MQQQLFFDSYDAFALLPNVDCGKFSADPLSDFIALVSLPILFVYIRVSQKSLIRLYPVGQLLLVLEDNGGFEIG